MRRLLLTASLLALCAVAWAAPAAPFVTTDRATYTSASHTMFIQVAPAEVQPGATYMIADIYNADTGAWIWRDAIPHRSGIDPPVISIVVDWAVPKPGRYFIRAFTWNGGVFSATSGPVFFERR